MARSCNHEELLLVAGKDVNMEVEESTALGAITKRQRVKTQLTEKT
jgi:hypothetical protein